MSVANCKDTWQIFHEVQQETLLLIALTETNCPRLPSNEAIMVLSTDNQRTFFYLKKQFQIPILNVGEELPQILLDIRSSQVVSWKSAVILYDSIFGTIFNLTISTRYDLTTTKNILLQNGTR